jgi:hypothetical protein
MADICWKQFDDRFLFSQSLYQFCPLAGAAAGNVPEEIVITTDTFGIQRREQVEMDIALGDKVWTSPNSFVVVFRLFILTRCVFHAG